MQTWESFKQERRKRNARIRRLARNGFPLVMIARKFGISRQRVQQIVKAAP